MVLMKRGGGGSGGGGVFYFGKKGGWKVIEKEANVNIQERCNNVHFDDRVKSSGGRDELLAFCVESIFDARVFHSGEKYGANWITSASRVATPENLARIMMRFQIIPLRDRGEILSESGLHKVRQMRRQEKKIDTILNTKVDHSGRDMAVVTITDDETIFIG